MRIPFFNKIFVSNKLRTEKINAEIALINAKSEALNKLEETKIKALEAVTQMATPRQSLNSELYGSSNYQSTVWSNKSAHARRLSRIAECESPAAQAMIGRFVDLVIGPRLQLQANPIWDLIPNAPTGNDQRQKIIKNIENRYKLWAKSPKSDYIQDKNHYKRSRINFENLLIDGEYINVLRYSPSRRKNPLSVQIIPPENLRRTSSDVAKNNNEIDGIEYNSKGAAVAYHIMDSSSGKSLRIPKVGPRSGRTFVIHGKLGKGPRGIGILAGIITELTKLSDFQALEIQAAVINALFAVWVETEVGGNSKKVVSKEGISGINRNDVSRNNFSISDYEARLNSTDFSQGGIIAQNLGEGQKLHSFDTKRPTANFSDFFKAVKRNLYSAKGMSMAVADYDFNGSYSAARGELLVFWNKILTFRFDHGTDYEDPIYKMWLWGEIENNNLAAPEFELDDTVQQAWSNANWTGPSRPDIDPLRSAKAAEVDSKNSWKTDSQIAAERGGGDFDENISRKTDENVKKAQANEPLVLQEKTTYSNTKTESETKNLTA